MRSATRVVTAALLVAAPTLAAVQADAAGTAPERCKGRVVTIGGTDGDDRITGTQGRDVIRTGNGDDHILGRGGNDVVCADRGADVLLGGAGNDRLHGGPFKLLDLEEEWGSEGDRLVGGRGDDRIFGGGDPSNEIHVAPEFMTPDRVEFPGARGGLKMGKHGVIRGRGIGRDLLVDVQRINATKWADDITVRGQQIVIARGGDDRVTMLPAPPDPQISGLVLGLAGDDTITSHGGKRSGYMLNGGTGRDRITGSRDTDYIFDDAGRGTARGGGSYDQINVTSRMSVRGQGGDDLLQVAVKAGPVAPINGGWGSDRFELGNRTKRDIRVSLPRHELRVGRAKAGLGRIERYEISAQQADLRFIGSGHTDRLVMRVGKGRTLRAELGGGDDRFDLNLGGGQDDAVGRGTVVGGSGDDILDLGLADYGVQLFGGDGDDELEGNEADNVLRGGPGNDTADGWGGTDLCRAETKEHCER